MSDQVTLYYFPYSFYSQKSRIYLKEKGVDFHEEFVDLMKLVNLDEWFMRLNPQGKVPVLKHGDKVVPDSHDIYLYGEEHLPGKSLLPKEHREEVLKLHETINDVDVMVLLYGCVSLEKYDKNTKLPKEIFNSLRARVCDAESLKDAEAKLSHGPADLEEVYRTKLNKVKRFTEYYREPGVMEAEIDKAERVLHFAEEKLAEAKAKLQGAGSNNAVTMLVLHEPTIADIDLVVLIFRLKILGLDRLINKETLPNVCRFYRQFETRPSFKHVYGTPSFS